MAEISPTVLQAQLLEDLQGRQRAQAEYVARGRERAETVTLDAERRYQDQLAARQTDRRTETRRLDDEQRYRDFLTERGLERARRNRIDLADLPEEAPRGSLIDVVA